MFRCTLDLSAFRESANETIRELERGIERVTATAAQEGADEARKVGQFQDRTGQLRRNIAAFRVSGGPRQSSWEVLAATPYAQFVEAGTKPHQIHARSAPYLVFYWPKVGRVVRFTRVNHPGSRPYPFMGPGLLKAERSMRAGFEGLISRISVTYWSG